MTSSNDDIKKAIELSAYFEEIAKDIVNLPFNGAQ